MSVDKKIDKLIEEANQKVADEVAKIRGGDVIAGVVPSQLVMQLASMHSGYKAGEPLGHPVAGTILGQEGAAGARSNWDQTVDIGDAYTGKNMLKRAAQGIVPGALIGIGVSRDLDAALPGAALGALGGALIRPGLKYGLGKAFGAKQPSKDRTI